MVHSRNMTVFGLLVFRSVRSTRARLERLIAFGEWAVKCEKSVALKSNIRIARTKLECVGSKADRCDVSPAVDSVLRFEESVLFSNS